MQVGDSMEYVNPLIFYGTEEVWKPITEFHIPEIMDYYLVSNFGRIYSKATNKVIKTFKAPNGYWYIYLSRYYNKTQYALHRIVLSVFTDTCIYTSLEPNHRNCNPDDNYLWNLEWVTRQGNIAYAREYGRRGCGEMSNNNKIDETIAIQICELLEQGMKPTQISKQLNTEIDLFNIVDRIRAGNSWYYISKKYRFLSRAVTKTFDSNQLLYIYDRLNKDSDIDILLALGFKLEGDYMTSSKRRYLNLIDKIKYDLENGIVYS